ncbi:MAG: flagellar biosynthesis protein FlhA [Clostridiales bacterium]|jgi:flagellar biosynthesis protein FlhA|nr:flagellar biosynthesis protein FlhA [Clostridiales bacterium]
MKIGDLVVGGFLIGAIIIMIIPLPPGLIDVFIILNFAIALIILFNALFSKEALNMSSFPTILLFTTVFRLAINVSSTRSILSTGDGGKVIETFGNFVGGGNVVIGIIVFMILVIVQFMVITKGSERVSEVSARFTLDAMPGKQMAIDADLNSGLIDEQQARERRQKIQDEASFYGSMDGASKFVKGDAVAGLLITFINIIGGIASGYFFLNLEIVEAMNKFTIMTIGDGLVGQLPALMISLGTGILVTKVSKEADVSDTLAKELMSVPKALFLSGGALVFLGIATPLPTLLLMFAGGLIITIGIVVNNNSKIAEVTSSIDQDDEDAKEIRKPENVISLLQVDPIELEFGYGIIPLADVSQGGDLLDRVVMIRRQVAIELGAVVPVIRLRDNIQLNPNQYIIKIKGIKVSEGEILFDHYMAMNPGYIEEDIPGVPTLEPAFNLPAKWISEAQRERAEALGYTVVDPPSIIATHLTEIVKAHLDELLTRQDVQTLISNVKESNPVLVEELIPKLLNIGEIQKVLQCLLREGVSIRDLITVFEVLADHASTTRDTDILTEYVRQALKRTISNKFFSPGEMTSVVTLDPTIEQTIMDSVKQTEQGAYITLEPSITQTIIKSVEKEVSKLEGLGKQPIVVTSPIVRAYFKKLTSDYLKDLIVISYNEIDSNVELQSVGMVTI